MFHVNLQVLLTSPSLQVKCIVTLLVIYDHAHVYTQLHGTTHRISDNLPSCGYLYRSHSESFSPGTEHGSVRIIVQFIQI